MVPEVSILIAAYNTERFIRACIESVLSQSLKNLEVVIVDDGSSDSTFDILREYKKNDERIRIFRNGENRGIAYTRNRAFYESKGEFIAIMDSDDEALPARLEKQVQFLKSHGEYGIVGSLMTYIDEDGRHMHIKEAFPKGGEAGDVLKDLCQICHSSCMFRREIFEKSGGYREEFERAVDLDLFLRVQEKGYQVYNLPEVLHHQRFSFTRGMVLYRREQFVYGELAKRLAHQRRNKGSDFLEEGNLEAFNILKKEISGRGRPRWIELSSNYFKWAHHMYYRGPEKVAKEFIVKSVAENPFNLKAWIFLIFLYSNKNVRNVMIKLKRRFAKKPLVND